MIKLLSQFFVFLLLIDAAYVAQGLLRSQNMWKWICVYWILLTCKNLVDAIGGMYAGKRKSESHDLKRTEPERD